MTRSNEVTVRDAWLGGRKDYTMRMTVQIGKEGPGHTNADEVWQTAVPGQRDGVTPSLVLEQLRTRGQPQQMQAPWTWEHFI